MPGFKAFREQRGVGLGRKVPRRVTSEAPVKRNSAPVKLQ